MSTANTTDLPAIHVFFHPAVNGRMEQLLLGMEEEQVPFFLKEVDKQSAVELGYMAAVNSSLGVGIGVGGDKKVVLHYAKLKPDHPVFAFDFEDESYSKRALGSNAARLVKGIPFKDLQETDEDDGTEGEFQVTREMIEQIARRILAELKEV